MKGGLFQFDQASGVIPPGSVTNAELAAMAARTVKANPTNASGQPQDVAGTTALSVLRVNAAGNGLEFGLPTPGSVSFSTAPRLLGRTTAGAGAGEEISVDASLTLATLTLSRAALTGDVTASAGSNATTIAANAVTDAKFRQSAGLSVVGRSANTTGNVADITGTDGQAFRVSGTTLGFGTLANAAFATNTIGLDKLENASAQYNIMARTSASAGAWQQKASSSDVFDILGAASFAAIRTLLGLGAAALLGVASAADARAQTSTSVLLTPANLNDRASFFADKNATNQTGIASSTFTQVTFSNELWDVGGLFASNAWVPPASKVNMGMVINASTATTFATGGFGLVSIFKNGTRFKDLGTIQFYAGQTVFVPAGDCNLNANGTDSFDLYVYADVTAAGTFSVGGNVTSTYLFGSQL